MRGVQSLDFDPANVDAGAITEALDIEVDADGSTTLELVFIAFDVSAQGLARQITLEDESTGGDNPNVVLTFYGTDADGRAQQESITDIEDNAAVKTTTGYYQSLNKITIGTDIEFDMVLNIGTNGVMVSKALALDKYAVNAPLVDQTLTGTLAWSLELCLEDLSTAANQAAVTWTDDADHSAISASQLQNLADWPAAFTRVKTTAYTDTAELAVRVSQGY